jgi:hypothetical protein
MRASHYKSLRRCIVVIGKSIAAVPERLPHQHPRGYDIALDLQARKHSISWGFIERYRRKRSGRDADCNALSQQKRSMSLQTKR